MEKRTKLAEEFGGIKAFGGEGSLYKKVERVPKESDPKYCVAGAEKVLEV